MSMWDWIVAAEAIVATGVAIEAILRASRWKQSERLWREEAERLAQRLAAEREANLLSKRYRRHRGSEQETSSAG